MEAGSDASPAGPHATWSGLRRNDLSRRISGGAICCALIDPGVLLLFSSHPYDPIHPLFRTDDPGDALLGRNIPYREPTLFEQVQDSGEEYRQYLFRKYDW